MFRYVFTSMGGLRYGNIGWSLELQLTALKVQKQA